MSTSIEKQIAQREAMFRLVERCYQRGLFWNGGRCDGVMYTLPVSARLQGLDPFAYLNDVLSRIGTHPCKQLEELLPQNGKPAAK